MKANFNSPYRNFFLIGLLCNIVAAWFSLGYHQIDEHFMILEYSNFKFGTVPRRVYPWEYIAQIRPTLQPTLAYCLFAFCNKIGLANPFVQVFILRLFSGILAWWVACSAALKFGNHLQHEKVRRLAIISLSCLWFLPYLQVRCSSENFAGIAFVAALLLLPNDNPDQKIDSRSWRWLLMGVLLGLSFYFRFQMAFAIIGVLIWLAFKARHLFKTYFFILMGALVAVIVNLLCDYWFYNDWVITPINYFTANIVQDAASTYGTTPWYDYIVLFVSQGIPPISIVLLILFVIALFKRPNQLMLFALVPFLVGHMVVPHKEFRFLYPMVVPFLLVCASGLDAIWPSIANKKWLKPSFKILVWCNILLMAYRIVWPAKPNHFYYKFLYSYAKQKPTHLITLGTGIYDEGHNEIYLYRPKMLQEDTMTIPAFRQFLSLNKEDSFLVMSYQSQLPFQDSNYNAQRLYVYLPDWIMNIQLNDWQSRSDIWTLWLLRRKP